MGVSTHRYLQNAAFFVVGKMFSLRGGVEHRNLKLSQLTHNHDPDHYVYQYNVSKTNSGSFKKLRIKVKNIHGMPLLILVKDVQCMYLTHI